MMRRLVLIGLGLLWLMQPCMAAEMATATASPTVKAVHKAKQHRHKHKRHSKKNHSHKPKSIPNDRRDMTDSDDDGSAASAPHAAPSSNHSSSFVGFLGHSIGQHLVNLVYKTVDTLRYSAYKLGGTHFDASNGVYIVDCSEYVDNLLLTAHPHAFYSLVNSTGAYKPTTLHYYEFFNELASTEKKYWDKINDATELQPGDILVFRNKHHARNGVDGHIMVVMDKPVADTAGYLVRVADSAPVGHSEDTRQHRVSGIGIGTLLLKVNAHTGQPSAYAWKIGSHWVKNVNFAMARPTGTGMLE